MKSEGEEALAMMRKAWLEHEKRKPESYFYIVSKNDYETLKKIYGNTIPDWIQLTERAEEL